MANSDDSQAATGEKREDARPKGLKLFLITIAMTLTNTMFWADPNMVTVILPYMQGSLSATLDQVSWVLTTFIVAQAMVSPVIGWLTARVGRKQLMLTCIGMFTTCACLCASADSISEIIIYRVGQGLCGAPLVALSQAVLLDAYPRERHGTAMGVWLAGVAIAASVGPVVSGYLTEHYSWRLVFFASVPLAAVTSTLIILYMRDTARSAAGHFDALGFCMIATGVAALQIMLDRGEREDWFDSSLIVLLGAVAAIGLYLFLVHTITTTKPLVNPRLMRDRNFALGMMFVIGFGVLQYTSLALWPPFVRVVLDMPMDTAGMVLANRGIGLFPAMLFGSWFVNRYDPRILMVVGLSTVALTLKMMSGFTQDSSVLSVVMTAFVQGAGFGATFLPLSAITFATLNSSLRSEGTALYNFGQNIGGSMGIAILVAVLSRSIQTNRSRLVEHATPYNELFREPYLPQLWSLENLNGLAAVNAEISRQATMIAYTNDFAALMFVALAAVPLMLLLKNPRSAQLET